MLLSIIPLRFKAEYLRYNFRQLANCPRRRSLGEFYAKGRELLQEISLSDVLASSYYELTYSELGSKSHRKPDSSRQYLGIILASSTRKAAQT